MLGLRFLDVDFMRINLGCASPTVNVIRIFCIVVKGGAAAWNGSRSPRRMEAPGRVRGMRRRHEPRGQPHFLAADLGPPVGGTFWFQIFIQASSPEIWRKTISGAEGGCWRGKWGGLFWATSLEKIFGGTTTLAAAKGRLISCTVPRSTPNCLAMTRTPGRQEPPGPTPTRRATCALPFRAAITLADAVGLKKSPGPEARGLEVDPNEA